MRTFRAWRRPPQRGDASGAERPHAIGAGGNETYPVEQRAGGRPARHRKADPCARLARRRGGKPAPHRRVSVVRCRLACGEPDRLRTGPRRRGPRTHRHGSCARASERAVPHPPRAMSPGARPFAAGMRGRGRRAAGGAAGSAGVRRHRRDILLRQRSGARARGVRRGGEAGTGRSAVRLQSRRRAPLPRGSRRGGGRLRSRHRPQAGRL